MHIKSTMQCDLMHEFSYVTADYEMVCATTASTLLLVVYRPPSGNVSKFLTYLEKVLDYVALNCYQLLLGGDMNINVLDLNLSRELSFALSVYGFCSVINTPTCVSVRSQSALDNFIVSVDTSIHAAGTISCGISDHCPVFIVCSYFTRKNQQRKSTMLYRPMSSENINSFRTCVLNCDWSSIYSQNDASEAYNQFLLIFRRIYNISFPYKTVKLKKKIRKPWVRPEHVKMINEKNKLFRKFLRSRESWDLATLKKYQKQIKQRSQKS